MYTVIFSKDMELCLESLDIIRLYVYTFLCYSIAAIAVLECRFWLDWIEMGTGTFLAREFLL